MSATNRSGLDRHEHDFYETPVWAIDALLDVLGIGADWDGYAIDPGAGTGAIAERIATRAPKADVRGIELVQELLEKAQATRSTSIAWECADWLKWTPDGVPDLIIANPPYGPRDNRTLAEQFIRKALEVAGKKGTVCMLLRLNYLVPKVRRSLRAEFGKPNMHALEKRPSFNGSGTDATDYAWLIWGPKRGGKWTVIECRSPESKLPPSVEPVPSPGSEGAPDVA